jgi:hypothetical protein
MRAACLLLLGSLLLPLAAAFAVPAVLVADDFDRPDGCAVGGGWSEYELAPCSLRLEGGRLVFSDYMQANRYGLAHRNMTLGPVAPGALPSTAPVTVSFNATGGASSLRGGRIGHGMTILDDGTGRGYGLRFARTDAAYANSVILRLDNGTVVDSLAPPVQLPAAFHVRATFGSDGAIAGAFQAPGGPPVNFTFGPRAIAASGPALAVFMVEFHDADPRPSLDDVRFSLA